MSFLQRIFGKSAAPAVATGSFREVLDQKAKCLTDGSPLNNHKRCFAVLLPINLFAYSVEHPVSGLAKYTSDSCLFELACYSLFSADMWSFGNALQIRESVQSIMSGQISHICEVSGLLAERDAYSLMNSRLEVYGGVASRNPSAEGLHLRLKQALYAASETAKPVHSSIDKVSITDAFSDFELTRALVAWDMKRMPMMDGLLRTIEIK